MDELSRPSTDTGTAQMLLSFVNKMCLSNTFSSTENKIKIASQNIRKYLTPILTDALILVRSFAELSFHTFIFIIK
jgi:hypothetical protein